MGIVQRIKPLAGFENYLNYGYYPFYMDNINTFHQKLDEIILTDLEIDLPQFASIIPANIVYLKKLLRIISNSVPFKPNMNSLSERTGISLNTLKNYVNLLKEVEVLKLLYFEDRGINSLNKPEKMYLNNTNLMYNQSDNGINKGNIRETFFFNQVSVKHKVNASKKADFLVDNRYTFEIGGKNKSQKQLSGVPNSYVVKDDIEIGNDNIIPLWLFGFLY
jgi:predicted AAA+ superfamily ATPase